MNSSNQTYKELAVPHFKAVFDLIDEVLTEAGSPYYLIGASALALELLKSGIRPSRRTKDIDFAVMVSTHKEYEALSQALVARGCTKLQAPWTFYLSDYQSVVDVLPFGPIEQAHMVQLGGTTADLHLLGFKEVLSAPAEVWIEEKIARIPTLSGMILLKLIAWSDRPMERGSDLTDILWIIQRYFEIAFDEIAIQHYDIVLRADESDFDRIQISAEVLGREAARFTAQSRPLEGRIIQLLDHELHDIEQSSIARKWAQTADWTLSYAHSVLRAFRNGFDGSL